MSPARQPPDLVGYTVDDAREILTAAGWQGGEVVDTRPPRRPLSGPRRVVRQREDEAHRIALVVCGERAEDARV